MQISNAQWLGIKVCIAGLLVGAIAFLAPYYREIWLSQAAIVTAAFLIADWKWNTSRVSFYMTLAFVTLIWVVIYFIAFVWNN
ncbi:hypothetical protein [Pseudomonas syringae]|uniref:hypothetical protein n=1 Tax=Pseudomonas syringae TaxID=317 RepID=UPI0004652E36|nr:hypothetical protein [Pseudomonas syringae]QGG78928.1 hypothetical protein N028_26750 [Pseudomonas syringae USA011]